jgi:hypothetical protein
LKTDRRRGFPPRRDKKTAGLVPAVLYSPAQGAPVMKEAKQPGRGLFGRSEDHLQDSPDYPSAAAVLN